MSEATAPARRVPRVALLLGAGGLLPLLAGTALVALGIDVEGVPARRIALAYAAVILAFLGGIHWGFAAPLLRDADRAPFARRLLAASVLPALAGWVAVLLPGAWAPLLLAFGFALVLPLDRWAQRQKVAPPWWLSLRLALSTVVVACLLLLAWPVRP